MTTMMMKRAIGICATAVALSALTVVPAQAQGTQDKPAPTPTPTLATRVDVTISRLQGEKKVASQPYVLMPSSGDPRNGIQSATVRVGVSIPVGTVTTVKLADPEKHVDASTTTETKYQNVSTNIDCRVQPLGDGKYNVYVSVSDSSLFTPDGVAKSDSPAIRSFQASNTLTMRDGQTMLLTTATDKVTGELLKIEVTFSVVK